MRTLLLFILINSSLSFADWHPNTFTNKTVFENAIQPFTRYMEQLNRNFVVDIFDDHIMFYKRGHYFYNDQFEVFIEREVSADQIITKLDYHHGNNYAGTIVLTRKGNGVKPIDNMELVLFKFKLNTDVELFKLDFTHFGVTLEFTNINGDKLSNYIFNSGSESSNVYVREYETIENIERRIWWACGGCHGDPALAILLKSNNSIRYYGKVGTSSRGPIVDEDNAKEFFQRSGNYQSGIVFGFKDMLRFAKGVFTWPNEKDTNP